MKNIILVGMPGFGKSTLGETFAQTLRYHYIDTDEVIMETYGKNLMELIEQHGIEGFIVLEGKVISSIYTNRAVISTGGSAIYYPDAMAHLRASGKVIYLYHDISDLYNRVGDMVERSVVCRENCNTLEALFAERSSLYEQYADYVIDMTGKNLTTCNAMLLDVVYAHGLGT
ncbi:MAG: shikimate kinase [Ruminococcus sp.]|nr:shikimate kinase [Ruminococcus sp.]